MTKWYEIKAKGPAADTVEVLIYGDIGDSWSDESVTAAEFVRDLQKIDAKNLVVRINSAGGSVPDGLAIYNALRRYPGIVAVAIDGVAVSIASLIAMAGETVAMAENSMLMIHAPWGLVVGNSADLREQAEVLDQFAMAMASSYARKSGKSTDDVLALLKDGKDHWYTAGAAVEAGFADEISERIEVEASARFTTERFTRIPAAAAAFLAHKEQSMPNDTVAAPNPAQPATAAVVDTPAAVIALPYARSAPETAELRTMFAAFRARDGVQAMLEDMLADTAISPDAASKRLLAHLGKDATPARPTGSAPLVETVADEADKRRAAGVAAILARAGEKVDVSALQGNPFRAYRMADFARDAAVRAGFRVDGRDMMEIVGAAFTQSTSDFPVLLETAMNKALQAAYAVVPDTWRRFCGVGSASDFRAQNRYQVGTFSNIELVNELAEFRNKPIPDGSKASITVVTKGNIVNLSRQAIVNDDLDFFGTIPRALGRAAARTIEADVYALLALNSGAGPTMGDGKALFHVDHGNIAGTAAVPSITAIDIGSQALMAMRDISGNDYLDIRPAVALVGLAQGGNMRLLNDMQYDPADNKFQKPNLVRGLFRDVIVSPRVSGTKWYMFADPNEAPVLEVAFLNGVQTPFLEMQNGFDVDGTRWKVRLDYGTGAIDYRGAFLNAGA